MLLHSRITTYVFYHYTVSLGRSQILFAYFYLGYIYQENGLTNFAIESYQKVLEISPDYSWAYFNLGSIAYKSGNIDDAKNYLLKTIEYNSSDIEAYKLLTKICLKQGEAEEILEILHTRLGKEENGDLFYCLARVYKFTGQIEEYYSALKSALKNPYTLTFQKDTVQKEFHLVEEKLDREEEIEPEAEIPEAEDEEFSGEDDEEDAEEEYEEYEEDDLSEIEEDDETNLDEDLEEEE